MRDRITAGEAAITQEELNSLLASLSGAQQRGTSRRGSGARGIHEARVHDFARSEGLSRTTVQLVEAVHAPFARAIAADLSTYLRAPFQVSLLSVDQLTYDQFVRSVPDPTMIAVITLSPIPGKAILELNPAIGFWIVDHLLGGEGEILNAPRPLTFLERAVMEGPISRMLTELALAWRTHLPVTAELVEITDSPSEAQIAKPTDAVVAASLEVTAGSLVGTASVCLPAISLKLCHLDARESGNAGAGASSDAVSPEAHVTATLTRVPVTCAIRLGLVEIPAADLDGLAEGDLLCLDRQVDEPLELFVGNAAKFHCRPRLLAGKLAVEIVGDVP